MEKHFDDEIINITRIFSQRIASIESVLISYSALLDVSEETNETEVSDYLEQIVGAYPYIDAIINMNRINQDEIIQFEQTMHQRGFINLKIKELNNSTESNKNYCFPINAIDPMTPVHASMLGLNLYSSNLYYKYIERAVLSGQVVASSIDKVLSPLEPEILMFKALYTGRYAPTTEQDRLSSVTGIVGIEINAERLIASLLSEKYKWQGSLQNLDKMNTDHIINEGLYRSFKGMGYIKTIKKYGQSYQLHIKKDFDLSLINKQRMIAIWLAVMVFMFFVTFIFNKRKIAEMALQASEKRFIRIAHATPIGIFQSDKNGQCIFINDSYKKLTKINEKDVTNRNWIDYIYPDDKKQVLEGWALVIKSNEYFDMDYRMLMPDQSYIWVHSEAAAECNEEDEVTSYLGTIQDITKQKAASAKIAYQAHFDHLTGLPNRFLTLDRLSHLLSDAQRHGDKVALLFIDLDDFKKVNDSLGHEAGDNLLIEAASRLNSVMRSSDTVGRIGGDEFLMIVGGLADLIEVTFITEKVIETFREPYTINGHERFITTSIGIALYPQDGLSSSELLANADLALYQAKDLGRNTFSFYTEQLNKENSRRLLIEENMRSALSRNEFSVVYQPKINVNDGSIMGAEALLRWSNKAVGPVSPDEFIPIAEQIDLIHELGEFVLRAALKETALWQAKFDSNFKIAVNLSPKQFRNNYLLGLVKSALEYSKVSADCLELEITEGLLLNKYDGIKEILTGLSDLGIQIAMDDFGTGYSSLNYLRSYPFDVLKIDRSFVSDMDKDSRDSELVYATIAMSHGLNIKVVAEGVETELQYTLLKQHQCDYAQGYLFSKPISATEMSTLLKQKKSFNI